jgi:hypothetical protein
MPASKLDDSFVPSLWRGRPLLRRALPALALAAALPACTRDTPGFCTTDVDCPSRNQFCSLPASQCSSAVNFHALLSGDQVVPPTASQADGEFTMVISDDLAWGHYTLNLNFAPPATNSVLKAAEIRAGAIANPIQVAQAFARISTATLPATGDLQMTTDLLTALRAGQYYITALSDTFPGGEIRGQIYSLDPADNPGPVHLAGILSGEESAPGNSSMGSGSVTADLNEGSGQLTLTYKVQNLGGMITAFHVHRGGFNVNGDIIYDLPPPAPTSTGDTVVVGIDHVEAPQSHLFGLLLKSGLSYFNVHSSTFAAGEVRAQLLPPSPSMTYPIPFNVPLAHATGSSALGEAEFFLSADKSKLAFRISHTAAGATGAMLVRGAGVAMPITCAALTASKGVSGAQGSCDVDITNMAAGTGTTMTLGDLNTSALNFVVVSPGFAMGELRGQVIVPK